MLGTRRLMHVNFEEFEAEMGAADQLFSKWDEECERTMSMLRELAKKKREDMKSHAGRLNLAHKRLQTRLENLKKYVLSAPAFLLAISCFPVAFLS